MRLVVQRVGEACVSIDGSTVGSIGQGLVVLVGIGHGDDDNTAYQMAEKLVHLRIFADEQGKTNLSVQDVGGEMLVVSQFTLYADTRRGRRPSFTGAAKPEEASRLVDVFAEAVRQSRVPVQEGRFGADMRVSLTNDGPFTIWLDSDLG